MPLGNLIIDINNFIIVQVHNAVWAILGCMPWRTTSCIPTKLYLVPISPYLINNVGLFHLPYIGNYWNYVCISKWLTAIAISHLDGIASHFLEPCHWAIW
jgi:hypothetical protein